MALGLPVKLNTFHNCTGVETNQIQLSPRAVGTVGAIGRPQTSPSHLLFPWKPDAYFPATWPTARSQKVRRVRGQARVLPVASLCQLHSARWPRVPMQTDGSYLSYQTVTWCGTGGLWALGQGVCASVLVCTGVCVGYACMYAGVYTHVCWYAHVYWGVKGVQTHSIFHSLHHLSSSSWGREHAMWAPTTNKPKLCLFLGF